jgi:FixJ family two-component response regulator
MVDPKSTVLVVDDDPDLRASVARLLRSLGLDTLLFKSTSDLLKSNPPDGPTCLVLDVRLPGKSGLDLQSELAAANRELPIIFITGHGDIRMSVRAMKNGAIEFLTKPFRDQDLLDAFTSACRGTVPVGGAKRLWPPSGNASGRSARESARSSYKSREVALADKLRAIWASLNLR